MIKFDDVPEALYQTFGGGAILVGLGWIGRQAFRFFSNLKVEIASDKAEVNQLARLDAATTSQINRLEAEVIRQSNRADRELERAESAFRERNEAIQQAANAVSEITLLRRHVEYLEKEVESLKKLLQAIYDGKPPEWQRSIVRKESE